jgi:hypothetical protein
VKYFITGDSNDFNITYKYGHEREVIQEPHVKKGWKYSFVGHTGDYFFLAAQSNKPKSSIRIRVYKDGKLLNQVEKQGDFPLVTASGMFS